MSRIRYRLPTYIKLNQVADLKRGDIVRNIFGSGDSYVVTDSAGSLATAVRSIEISNAAEWEVLQYRGD